MATINDVATVFASTPVVFTASTGSVSVSAYDFAATPNTPTAKTPCRVLLPLGRDGSGGRSSTFIALNTLTETTWQLTDLFLWRPVAQGLSLANVGGDLLKYATAYREIVRGLRVPAKNFVVEQLDFEANVWTWPMNGNTDYFGVACTLTIKEYAP